MAVASTFLWRGDAPLAHQILAISSKFMQNLTKFNKTPPTPMAKASYVFGLGILAVPLYVYILGYFLVPNIRAVLNKNVPGGFTENSASK